MILKRPYAFLVKHFRIIHAILLLCFGFITMKTWDIVSFFGTYIRNDQTVSDIKELADTYVTTSMYFVVILSLIVSCIIIYLLRYKKKPILVYLYMTILDIILIVAYYYLYSFLYDMQFSAPDLRVVNIIRDMFRLLTVAHLPLLVICFIRAIGFDVKKFDFKKDILDLGIETSDNEEYEFDINIDKDDFKEKFNRGSRLFKYFYKENKFIFTGLEIIVGVAVLVFVVTLIKNREIFYSENDAFDVGNLRIQVLESYKTDRDAIGVKFNSKYFYIVTKVRFTNNAGYDTTINTGNMKVEYSDGASTMVIKNLNERMSEFGTNYFSQILRASETRDFVFIFEVPNEYYNEDFVFKYLNSLTLEENELKYEYLKVKLSPKEFDDKVKKVSTKEIGEKLTFKESVLGNTNITINSMELSDSFLYKIVRCSKDTCTQKVNQITPDQTQGYDLTVMKLNIDLNFDRDKLGSKYNVTNFITKYGSIRFVINGKEYNNSNKNSNNEYLLKLNDITPYITDNYVYLEVRDRLKSAEKIYLDFTIRDKVYTYVLKDTTKEEVKEETETPVEEKK